MEYAIKIKRKGKNEPYTRVQGSFGSRQVFNSKKEAEYYAKQLKSFDTKIIEVKKRKSKKNSFFSSNY